MIHDELQDIMRRVFNNPDLAISDDMNADDVENWDSLTHINLVIEVEKHFETKFKNAEIARLQCIGDFKALIRKKRPELG
jgi:acyl carrier protein